MGTSLPLLEGFALEPQAAHRRCGHPYKVLTIVTSIVLFQTLALLGLVAWSLA